MYLIIFNYTYFKSKEPLQISKGSLHYYEVKVRFCPNDYGLAG